MCVNAGTHVDTLLSMLCARARALVLAYRFVQVLDRNAMLRKCVRTKGGARLHKLVPPRVVCMRARMGDVRAGVVTGSEWRGIWRCMSGCGHVCGV